jgi:hypothetical protein
MFWAFSLSFQKSAFEVTAFSSSTRLRLLSTSKPPPQLLLALFELD